MLRDACLRPPAGWRGAATPVSAAPNPEASLLGKGGVVRFRGSAGAGVPVTWKPGWVSPESVNNPQSEMHGPAFLLRFLCRASPCAGAPRSSGSAAGWWQRSCRGAGVPTCALLNREYCLKKPAKGLGRFAERLWLSPLSTRQALPRVCSARTVVLANSSGGDISCNETDVHSFGFSRACRLAGVFLYYFE